MRQGEVRAWAEVRRRRADDIAVEVAPSLLLIQTLSIDMRRLPLTPRGATRREGPIRNETPRQITASHSHPYPVAEVIKATELVPSSISSVCHLEYRPWMLVVGCGRQPQQLSSKTGSHFVVTCTRLIPLFARLDSSSSPSPSLLTIPLNLISVYYNQHKSESTINSLAHKHYGYSDIIAEYSLMGR